MARPVPTRVTSMVTAVVLVVVALFIPSATAATTTLVSEGFEGASFPPSGWAAPAAGTSFVAPQNTTGIEWTRDATCDGLLNGNACMEVTGTASNDSAFLALPSFNTNSVTSPKLELMVHVTNGAQLQLPKKMGLSDTQMESSLTVPALSAGFNQVSIDLEANKDYAIAIGFRAQNAGDILRVDSVSATGTSTAPPPNTAPSANAVSVTGLEDQVANIHLSGVDNESTISYSVQSQPAKGTLSGTAPLLFYTPNKDFYGTDSFTYRVSDAGGLESGVATVSITIDPVNDKPTVTMPDSIGSRQGQDIFFSSAQKREIKVADLESEAQGLPVDFYVAAAQAPATLLGDISGLTFTSGDGTDDRSMTGSGTISAINAALSRVRLTPERSFVGTANLAVGIEDRGQTGFNIPGAIESHTEVLISSGPDAYAALPDKPLKSQVGINIFDDGTDQVLNTDVCWCTTKVTLGAQTAGLTEEDVRFKVETTGDLVHVNIYEGQDAVTNSVLNGNFQRTVYPGPYGGRGVRMELNLGRAPTNPDEEQIIKFTATSVPRPNDTEPASSDVVIIKVKARNYKPDLLLSQGYQEAGAIGNDRYESVFAQNTTVAPAGHDQWINPKALQVGGNAQGVNIWIQNDGTGPDTYNVQGDSGGFAFDVIYYDKFGGNITSQVTSGNYATQELEPKALGGNSQQIRMVLTARAGAPPGYQERFRFRTSTPGHADGDIVSVLAEVAQDIQPDLFVLSEQHNNGVGYGKFAEHFGVAHRWLETGEIGGTNRYRIALDNTNTTKTGQMRLTGNVTQPGFSVKFIEENWTNDPNANGPAYIDVTTQMKNGSYVFDLAPNRLHMVFAEVTTLPTANPFGFPNELRVQAVSLDGLPKNQDHIVVESRAAKFQPDITGGVTASGSPQGGAGNDVYSLGSATGPQSLTQNIGAGETVNYYFNVSADGIAMDDEILLEGTTVAQPGYTIKWFNGTTDITSAIAAGTYTQTIKPYSSNLPAAYQAFKTIRAEVKAADDSKALPPQLVSLTATSNKSIRNPQPSDTFTTTTRLAYRPDLILATSNGRAPVGNGVFSRTATTQVNSENLRVGVVNQRFLSVQNAGSQQDSYVFTITPPTGMKVTFGTNTSPGTTYTTPPVPAGSIYSVPIKIKLPSDQEIDKNISMGVDVKSVTRPNAHGDTGTYTFTPKFECLPNFIQTVGNITMNGNCVQYTDEGWLISKDFTLNRLDFTFGSKVAFINKDTMTLTASDVTIKYGGTNVVIFDAPGRISLPLTAAGGSLNGDGTSSQVYGLTIGAGPVSFKFPSSNTAEVGLPLKPLAVFGQNAASQPLTVPVTGAAPPTTPPAGTTMNFPTLQLGPIGVGDVITKYDAATQTWLGYGRAGFPNLPVPKLPAVEIAMQAKGGSLNFAYLRMKAGVAGIPVGPMTVNKLEAEVRLNPSQVIGTIGADLAPTPVTLPGAGEKKLPLFSVDGKFYVSGYKVSVKGAAKLLGFLEFGSFQATYEYGGVMRMTAVLNHSIDIGIGTLGVRSEIDGSVDSNTGRFQIMGSGTASLGIFSAGIDAVLSSKGIAACGRINLAVKTVGVGFGMKWSNASIQGFTGCNLDDYKDVNAPAHVDFNKLSADTEALLGQVDPIRAQIASASAALRNIGLPSLSGL